MAGEDIKRDSVYSCVRGCRFSYSSFGFSYFECLRLGGAISPINSHCDEHLSSEEGKGERSG